VIIAVLTSEPVAFAATAHTAVYVTDPPAGRLTVSLILLEPEAVQLPPPAPAHVQLQFSSVGSMSSTNAPFALLGPALLAVIV
jgi:hypothetical protein